MSQAIAVLDIIMEADRGMRYFSYQPSWRRGDALAAMSDGSGNEYWIVFAADGAAYAQGFDHESEMSPWDSSKEDVGLHEGILDGIPTRFLRYVNEPAFGYENVPSISACLWTLTGAPGSWRHGAVPPPGSPGDTSGAAWLFRVVSSADPAAYVRYAADYFWEKPDPGAVAQVYLRRPLDDALVSRIKPDRGLYDVQAEVEATGYPVAG